MSHPVHEEPLVIPPDLEAAETEELLAKIKARWDQSREGDSETLGDEWLENDFVEDGSLDFWSFQIPKVSNQQWTSCNTL